MNLLIAVILVSIGGVLMLATTIAAASALGNARLAREAKIQMQEAQAEAERQRLRALEQFEVIESSSRETKRWQELYRVQGVGAGNAQRMLLDEIERLHKELDRLGKKHGFEAPKASSDLEQLVQEFQLQHVVVDSDEKKPSK